MRALSLVMLLVASTLLASVSATGPGDHAPVITSATISPAAVDLIANNGGTVQFKVQANAGGWDGTPDTDDSIVVVRMVLAKSNVSAATCDLATSNVDVFCIYLASAGNGNWTYNMPVDTKDLTTGTWIANFTAIDSNQGTTSTMRNLTVAASNAGTLGLRIDDKAPTTGNTYDKQTVNGAVSFRATPRFGNDGTNFTYLVNKVHYVIKDHASAANSTTVLTAPYNLHTSALPDGDMTILMVVTDRLGRNTNVRLPLLVDTMAPVLEWIMPSEIYLGVEFDAKLNITEVNGYDLNITLGGNPLQNISAIGSGSHDIPVTINSLSNQILIASAEDALGNSDQLVRVFSAVKVPVAPVIDGLMVDGTPPLVGDFIIFKFVSNQTTNVTSAAMTVTTDGPGAGKSMPVTIPVGSSVTTRFNATFGAGMHSIAVTGSFDTDVYNVTGNATDDLDFEVFLGRIKLGDRTFYVRANSQNLPLEVVDLDNNETFAISLVDDGLGTAYEFTVGHQVIRWSQADRDIVVEPTAAKEKGFFLPGPGPALGLLALVGAALLARRR